MMYLNVTKVVILISLKFILNDLQGFVLVFALDSNTAKSTTTIVIKINNETTAITTYCLHTVLFNQLKSNLLTRI